MGRSGLFFNLLFFCTYRLQSVWDSQRDPITSFECAGGRGFITEYIYAIKMLLTRKK